VCVPDRFDQLMSVVLRNMSKKRAPAHPLDKSRRICGGSRTPEEVKHTKSKKNRGLTTKVIVYRDRRYPDGRPRNLKVDVRQDDVLDNDHVSPMVAVRTGTPLPQVQILKIREA